LLRNKRLRQIHLKKVRDFVASEASRDRYQQSHWGSTASCAERDEKNRGRLAPGLVLFELVYKKQEI
jgi:hypothetical protein